MTTGHDLHYAPSPTRRSRWLRPRRVSVVAAVFVLAASPWWWPPLWWAVRVHYYFARCERFTYPESAVVYDRGKAPGQIPADWSQFYQLLSPPGFNSDGTIFLHRVRTPSGQWRLVAIDIEVQPQTQYVPTARVRVFKAGQWIAPPLESLNWNEQFVFSVPRNARVLAGRVVAGDESRFTFTVLGVQNQRHDYEGYFTDDDHCTIEPLRVPANGSGSSKQPLHP